MGGHRASGRETVQLIHFDSCIRINKVLLKVTLDISFVDLKSITRFSVLYSFLKTY